MFSIIEDLAREALKASAALPKFHPQRRVIRNVVFRLQAEMGAESVEWQARAEMVADLCATYDAGAKG